jgi:hypothetical protein
VGGSEVAEQGTRRDTYLDCSVRAADPDSPTLWVPPKAHVLRSGHHHVELAKHVIKRYRFLDFSQAKRGFHRQLRRHDKPRAAQAGECGEKQVAALVAGARDELAVCKQHCERDDVAWEHLELDPRAVRRGRNDTAQRLRGNRTEIVHGKTIRCKLLLQIDKRDAGFCDYIAFLNIDLRFCQSVK